MKPAVPVAVVAALTLGLAACGTAAADRGNPHELRVVVGFYPLQYLAERIGGDDAVVTSLAQPGAEPHDLELKPRQIGQVAQADLVLYAGGVQPAVDDAVAQNARGTSFDVLTATDIATRPGADGGGPDPHVWLDPNRYADLATAVETRMAAADSGHAEDYRARGATLQADLRALDAQFRAGLAGCERSQIVTTHAAFGYLAAAYGLQQVGIAGISPDDEPSPQALDDARRFARDHAITTVFYEPTASPEYAETVAAEVGAGTAVLSPIEVVADGEDYLSVMRADLAALKVALGCRRG